MSKKVKYLVADTSAFIRNAQLQYIGENVITLPEVVNEVKCNRQLKRLVVLPYDLVIKDAFTEDIAFITQFSKKTGDYPSLSATDIKVMALAYRLEREHVGTEHLKSAPEMTKSVEPTQHSMAKPTDTVGFYLPDKVELDLSEDKDVEVEAADLVRRIRSGEGKDEDNESGISDGEELSGEEGEGDDHGWITPANLKKAKRVMGGADVEERPVTVACLTTDFAMQNVLKQIGLNVVSVDGMLIKRVKTYILRCYACFKTTSVMTKVFCPKCGNKTLKRVAVTVDDDGKQTIHINFRRPLTARGKRYSLPMPKGGKHALNPILCEDQRMPQQRLTKLAKAVNDPLDPDYIAGYSPFLMRDVNSKSVMLGLHRKGEFKYWMKKNPNVVDKHRKKK
ncbi:hypothetical protein AAG570_001693 [Ranatra chinensis]|uniref:RNA-binding protein NOB1 n=1 Tax=Ranatra chinensis TaxID=642074 RepID=A0ABD0YVT6_9HEMI